jgi:hypothetical protein
MQTLWMPWTADTGFMTAPAEIRLAAEDPRPAGPAGHRSRERPRALFALNVAHENEEESIGGYR